MEQNFAAARAALQRAAEAVGGQAALATACGFSDRRHVWPWFNVEGRRVPADHCPSIERETRRIAAEKGDASLIVTCEQLRPDVAWGVLRDSPDAPPSPPAEAVPEQVTP